jgi:predicted secreted protein
VTQDSLIRLRVGETFDMLLPGYGTSGYQWIPRVIGDVAVKRADAPASAAPRRPGDSVGVHFAMVGTNPGRATVTFELIRPWQPDAIAESRRVELDIMA